MLASRAGFLGSHSVSVCMCVCCSEFFYADATIQNKMKTSTLIPDDTETDVDESETMCGGYCKIIQCWSITFLLVTDVINEDVLENVWMMISCSV